MLQRVICSIPRSLLFIRLLDAAGIRHRPQMWEKQLCRCRMGSSDVGARAALARAGGLEMTTPAFPLLPPASKAGLGSTKYQ